MSEIDLILIGQSEVVDYGQYSKFSLDRIELYKDLVFPRMIHYQGRMHSHIDLLNVFTHGRSYSDAEPHLRREMLNIWNLPGMSGVHLGNYLLSFGLTTKLINNFDSEFDLIEETYHTARKKPLVGISSTFYMGFREIRRICKFLHGIDPKMNIVLGGAFANSSVANGGVLRFEKAMRKCGINYLLHAFNSESDLRFLMEALRRGMEPNEVQNLAYFENNDPKNGELKVTEKVWNQPVLNENPVNWSELDLPFINHTIQTRTVSGCPFNCAFCSYPTTAGGHHLMDLDHFEKHLCSLLRIPGVNRIVFIDDTFNVPPTRFKKLLKMFMRYDFEWFSFLRCQYVNDEQAKMMKDSGCQGVYLGVESASDVVLKNMNKRASRADLLRGANLLSKYNIPKMVAFVLGFPGETEQTIQENRTFLRETSAEFYTLKEFYYMEHTSVHAKREEYQLSGTGNTWKHATMDSSTATAHRHQMFIDIEDSIHIDPDISLWHWIYLYDQGYTMAQVQQIQRETNTIIKAQMQGKFDEEHPSFGKLKKLVSTSRTVPFVKEL